MKRYLGRLWRHARSRNIDDILDMLEPDPDARLLDLGCDVGALTMRYAKRIGTSHVTGADFLPGALAKARKRGVDTKKVDLNGKLPFRSNSFDVVTTNQVIEHLLETDIFVEEIHRVLKPGGYAIISTENLASWHNIFALTLGLPAFSQHISSRKDVGNPMSLVSEQDLKPGWSHVKIFTLTGLSALCELHHLAIVDQRGAGFYPWPPLLANLWARLSPRHSAFIAVKGRKAGGRKARSGKRTG